MFSEYECLANDAMHVSRSIQHEQNVLVIQPYIKWGPRKSAVPVDLRLQEAKDLIKSLDNWNIQDSIKVGLLNIQNKSYFGKGKLTELRNAIHRYNEESGKRVSEIV